MMEYWDSVWAKPDINEYIGYVEGYATAKSGFLDLFVSQGVKTVCDAACGFGAYSVMLRKNGFMVKGFDISINSIELTREILQAFDCPPDEYKVCGITDIHYRDAVFDAAIAHAVIDHLPMPDAGIAIQELFRIIKPKGLLYLSFDGLSQEDIDNEHQVLDDGSFLYSDGLLFHYYTDDDIRLLLHGKNIVYESTNERGDRELVLQKEAHPTGAGYDLIAERQSQMP
jgi:SAM-dependent methyltransferase